MGPVRENPEPSPHRKRPAWTGASVVGIDAAPALAENARARVAEGRFDVGDSEALPYVAGSFDVVTALNGLQSVPDPLAAVAGVRRAVKPGGSLSALVWGRRRPTDLVAVMNALHPRVLARPPGAREHSRSRRMACSRSSRAGAASRRV
jgi:ubiquinone/menaquinone biosynthesis C-methylase UbiE